MVITSQRLSGWWRSWSYVRTLLRYWQGLAQQYPQTAYAGLQKSLQREWYLIQSVPPHLGEAFRSVEDYLENYFLLALIQGVTA